MHLPADTRLEYEGEQKRRSAIQSRRKIEEKRGKEMYEEEKEKQGKEMEQ